MFSFGFHITNDIYETNDAILSEVSAYSVKASDVETINQLLMDSNLKDYGVVIETSDNVQIYNSSTINESLVYNKDFEDLNINDLDTSSSLDFIFYLNGDYDDKASAYKVLTDNGIDLSKSLNVEDFYYSTFKIPTYKKIIYIFHFNKFYFLYPIFFHVFK